MLRRRPVGSILLVAGALLLLGAPLWAGLRGPGKYSGVVFFDRWATCILLSGPYLTYISESAKEPLRSYAGKSVQIDAVSVFQPDNPGDALVRKYTILGPAPAPQFIKLDGLDLRLSAAFKGERRPHFFLSIRNEGTNVITVLTQEVGITVLGANKLDSGPSDGLSDAIITRASVFQLSFARQWRSKGRLLHASSAVVGEIVMPDHIELRPGQVKTYTVVLDISPGQYQFVFGYGGGVQAEASLISNAISFNVSPSGLAVPVK